MLISSALPGEGKTTSAAALAILIAGKGSRVLLVDADLRRPSLTRYFDTKRGGGLAEAVAAASLEPFVAQVAPSLDLLASEDASERAPEILGSAAFSRLLDQAAKKYDFVICDAPPLLPVADALLLLPLAEGMIVVAAAGQTHIDALWDAIEHVRTRNGNLIGVILNRVDFRGVQYRYYGKYPYKKRGPTPAPVTPTSVAE